MTVIAMLESLTEAIRANDAQIDALEQHFNKGGGWGAWEEINAVEMRILAKNGLHPMFDFYLSRINGQFFITKRNNWNYTPETDIASLPKISIFQRIKRRIIRGI